MISMLQIEDLTYTLAQMHPTALTTDGRLWYSSIVDEVDILVHDGTTGKVIKMFIQMSMVPSQALSHKRYNTSNW